MLANPGTVKLVELCHSEDAGVSLCPNPVPSIDGEIEFTLNFHAENYGSFEASTLDRDVKAWHVRGRQLAVAVLG